MRNGRNAGDRRLQSIPPTCLLPYQHHPRGGIVAGGQVKEIDAACHRFLSIVHSILIGRLIPAYGAQLRLFLSSFPKRVDRVGFNHEVTSHSFDETKLAPRFIRYLH